MKLRYSTISDYYTCPELFRLKHIEKVPSPAKESLSLTFGTGLHLALETLFDEGLDVALDTFRVFWDSVDFSAAAPGRLSPEVLLYNAEIFLNRFDRLHKKHFKPLHLEKKLSITSFEGTADVIGEYKGLLSVIDFKTSAYRYPKERILSNEQMPLYAYMAETELGLKIDQLVYVVFIKHEKDPSISVQTAPYNQETKSVVALNMERVKHQIDTSRKENCFFRNTKSCLFGPRPCDYFNHCWRKK